MILWYTFHFLSEESNVQVSFDSDMFNCEENMMICQVTGSLTGFSGDIETDFSIILAVNDTFDPLTGNI